MNVYHVIVYNGFSHPSSLFVRAENEHQIPELIRYRCGEGNEIEFEILGQTNISKIGIITPIDKDNDIVIKFCQQEIAKEQLDTELLKASKKTKKHSAKDLSSPLLT